MALGTNRARNYGKDDQVSTLAAVMRHFNVCYEIRKGRLFLAGVRGNTALPLHEACASLVNVSRGQWEARHLFDDRVLAKGISERDVIARTIGAVLA